jgi:hypothetical protein
MRWKRADGGLVLLQREAELSQVIRAGHPPSRLARGLDSRQEQPDE